MEGRCESDHGGIRCIQPPSETRRKLDKRWRLIDRQLLKYSNIKHSLKILFRNNREKF